jgi:hypothetical protein
MSLTVSWVSSQSTTHARVPEWKAVAPTKRSDKTTFVDLISVARAEHCRTTHFLCSSHFPTPAVPDNSGTVSSPLKLCKNRFDWLASSTWFPFPCPSHRRDGSPSLSHREYRRDPRPERRADCNSDCNTAPKIACTAWPSPSCLCWPGKNSRSKYRTRYNDTPSAWCNRPLPPH